MSQQILNKYGILVDEIHKTASDQRSRKSTITLETYRPEFGKRSKNSIGNLRTGRENQTMNGSNSVP